MAEEKKGKEKMGEKEKKEEKKDEVITAIYKVNLHCHECGRKIKKHLLITQGVQSVEFDIEKGEIKAKGKLDPLKILKLIERKSNKKVELISPKIKVKDTPPPPQNKPKETKEAINRTITVKVHMHCDKCERDLQNRLLKHKGIFSVKTEQKAQRVTIEGSIEAEKLLRFLKRRVHKNAEIISSKDNIIIHENKKEAKSLSSSDQSAKQEAKKSDGNIFKSSEKLEKEKLEKEKLEKEKLEKEKLEKEKLEKEKLEKEKLEKEKLEKEKLEKEKLEKEKLEKDKERKEIENKELGDTKREIVVKDNVPYIIHYVYAPQLFSDDNPNACSIL